MRLLFFDAARAALQAKTMIESLKLEELTCRQAVFEVAKMQVPTLTCPFTDHSTVCVRQTTALELQAM